MYRLFYFIVLNVSISCLFVQCKDAPATEKIATAPIAEETTTTKEVEQIVDSVALVKEEIVLAKPMKEDMADIKKVVTKPVIATKKKEAPKPVKKKRAKIKFDELVHKFGTIKTGDKVSHQFKFKNTGNAPLVIKNVDVSCGCTFPSYPFLPIKPGKEGVIDVTFDSEHKVGRQKPTVTVVTNGRPRTIKLNLEGFVE